MKYFILYLNSLRNTYKCITPKNNTFLDRVLLHYLILVEPTSRQVYNYNNIRSIFSRVAAKSYTSQRTYNKSNNTVECLIFLKPIILYTKPITGCTAEIDREAHRLCSQVRARHIQFSYHCDVLFARIFEPVLLALLKRYAVRNSIEQLKHAFVSPKNC